MVFSMSRCSSKRTMDPRVRRVAYSGNRAEIDQSRENDARNSCGLAIALYAAGRARDRQNGGRM